MKHVKKRYSGIEVDFPVSEKVDRLAEVPVYSVTLMSKLNHIPTQSKSLRSSTKQTERTMGA